MVVSNLGIVHRMTVKRSRKCFSYLAEQDGYFLENILADVSAACAGISRDFLLIEALGNREGLVCRKAVASVGFLLQGSKVVQEWWRGMRYLSCDRFYRKLALTAKCSESSLCQSFILIVFTANGFQRHALFLCVNG